MENNLTFNDLPNEIGKLSIRIEQLFEFLNRGKNEKSERLNGSNDEPLLLKEACAFLKISPPTLYRYCKKRQIISYKNPDSGKLYFLKKDLMDYLMNGKRKTISEIQTEVFKNTMNK